MGFFGITSGGGPASVGNPNDTYEAIGWGGTGNKTSIVTGGVAHTKTSYTSLGTPSNDWSGFYIYIARETSTSAKFLFDIRKNGTTIICPDIYMEGQQGNSRIYIPLKVANGTTLDCRVQSNVASAGIRIGLVGIVATASAKPGFDTMTAIVAADTSTTRPSSISVASATSVTYTQIIASTASSYGALLASAGLGGTNPTNQDHALIIATGGAGSETEIARGSMTSGTATPFFGRTNFLIEKTVASSTRLAAAILAPTADTSPFVTLHGFS